MKKFFFYIPICILFILVTFFGLGPVLYADGSRNERLITLLVVIVIYLILIAFSFFVQKKLNKK